MKKCKGVWGLKSIVIHHRFEPFDISRQTKKTKAVSNQKGGKF